MFGGGMEWRPRPTPGCSAIEEEEVKICVKNQQIHQFFIQLINYVW
jgi:hypothetical protein